MTERRLALSRLLPLVFGALLAAGFLWSQKVHPRPTAQAAAGGTPVKVESAPVELAAIPVVAEAVGTVRSRRQTAIAARVLAEVKEVLRKPGDHVEAGDVLIVLDSRDFQARVEQAKAQLEARKEALAEARTETERTKNLFERQAATQQDMDVARFRLSTAEAELVAATKAVEEAEIQLDHATIVAPFAGVIFEKLADPGDLASPGKPLLGLYDPEELRLEALVEERFLWALELKDEIEIGVDALGAPIVGTVSEIVPAVDPATRTGTVKLDLPTDSGVRPGMFGRARVAVGERRAVVVPEAAIVRRGQLELVFLVEGEPSGPRTAWMRLVRVGERVPGEGAPRVELLSGLDERLAASARIVTTGAFDLADGDPIEEGRK